jgi:enterochelin esterase-like enzyme
MVIACPVTPNPWKLDGAWTLDRYADWLTKTLLPAVRERAPVIDGRAAVGLDGCSLGGYVGLEVFLRKPEAFGTLGVVQPAISVGGAAQYARRIADAITRAGPCPVHVETSTGDPYRNASEELARQCLRLGVACELRVIPGPHDQSWLREIGTAEMVLWHDRKLR